MSLLEFMMEVDFYFYLNLQNVMPFMTGLDILLHMVFFIIMQRPDDDLLLEGTFTFTFNLLYIYIYFYIYIYIHFG